MNHVHAPIRLSLLAMIVAVLTLALLAPGLAGAKAGNGHGPPNGKAKVHKAKAHGHPGKGHPGKGHHGHPGKGKVVATMTRNLYLGANLTPAIGVTSIEALAEANGQILREVTANSFPTRARGLAAEILEKKPDLVGLQEVALWRTAPPSLTPLVAGPSATTVRYDYLAELLAELNRGKGKDGKGKPQYEVVVVQNQFDLEAPADENNVVGDGPGGPLVDAEINGRLTMRDVILARRGAGVQTWNAQSAHFATLLKVPILTAELAIARGWTATDAKVRGSKPFRFVNTHLEAFHPGIRLAQAGELVAPGGPATSSSLPVVLLGDLNSDDDTVAFPDTLAYEALETAGMVSVSTDDPLSCCLGRSLLAATPQEELEGSADFDHQVDHIMTRDPDVVTLRSSSVTGLLPVNGFWSSDHAGVFSALRFAR